MSAEASRVLPKSVDKMEQGKKRVPVSHVGAGIPHNSSDPLTHIRAVTVNGTVGTCRLVLLKWASIETLARIRCKSLAIEAQSLFRFAIMMSAAINADHGFHGLMFPADSARLSFIHN